VQRLRSLVMTFVWLSIAIIMEWTGILMGINSIESIFPMLLGVWAIALGFYSCMRFILWKDSPKDLEKDNASGTLPIDNS